MRSDIVATNLGTIITLEGVSNRGRLWLKSNVQNEPLGLNVIAEHRYGIDIIVGAKADGLRVRDSRTGRFA